ncbi:MAG: tetratricopeptide repeat protein [Planctomycetaceae bacterium]|nr:tetratricopeptide repeat protein [Planctomycetaceae bacterium]
MPPLKHDGPSERKALSPLRDAPRPDINPSVGIFRPRTDSLAGPKPPIGPPHDRDGHSRGGPGDSRHDRDDHGDRHFGGPSHRNPFHGGIDHRGPPHGTPRHDYRMHGTLDRHSHYPGYYSYGRYGYGYRGSSFSIYLGSSLYNYPSYTYYEPYYYSVPYYVPYTVPVPYVVEEVVEGAAVEPSPAVTAPMVENGAVIPAAENAAEFQLQAERAFQEHRYDDAARLSNHAIVEDNQNGKLHLFASQTFFALEDYASAAAAVQQAASLLDRSQWGFVVENYQEFYRGEDYVTQMAKLDEYIAKNPDAAHAYFLRGYHFLFLGHKEAARDDLAKAFALENRDLLAAELLKMAGGTVPEPAVVPPQAEIILPPPGEQAKPDTDS